MNSAVHFDEVKEIILGEDKANYNKMLRAVNKFEKQESFLAQIRKPKLKDKEVVSLVLVVEYLGIDSEYELFRKISKSSSSLIEKEAFITEKKESCFHS